MVTWSAEWRLEGAVYCAFDAFSRLDLRVELEVSPRPSLLFFFFLSFSFLSFFFSAVYCAFDAFSRLDLRVELEVPPRPSLLCFSPSLLLSFSPSPSSSLQSTAPSTPSPAST